MTEIDVWGFDLGDRWSGPLPGRIRVKFQCTGRRQFTDPSQPPDDGDTTFAGMLDLVRDESVPWSWRLSSGQMQTLDERLGYVFTSRRETEQEYRARAGVPLPPAAGSLRTFRVTAGFAEHDFRFGSEASMEVLRESAPDRYEAEELIRPVIWDVTVQALGDGDWRPSLSTLDVVELRDALPAPGFPFGQVRALGA